MKNMLISIIMSFLSILLCLSVPFAVLESPSDIFKEMQWNTVYSIVSCVEKYFYIVNYTIIVVGIILVVVSLDTVLDGIKHTNIKLSPWVEKGKYAALNNSGKRRYKTYLNCEQL